MIAQGAPLWKRHAEIIRIVGLGGYLYVVLGLDWVEGWVNYIRDRDFYEDMDYRFGCALEHACGLSKTGYDFDTMRRAIDERVQETCDNYVEEGVSEGWLQRVHDR